MKPRVFVGSSAEGLEVAEGIHYNLDHLAQVTPWSAGFFDLSAGALDTLLCSLDRFDFAIFVFSSDDILRIHGQEQPAPRDNVVFELGLFIGRLGRERCFLIVPRGAGLRLPTDLAGLIPGDYEPNREDGNLRAALVPACSDIKDAMRRLGRVGSPEEEEQPPLEAPQPTKTDLRLLDQECVEPHNLGANINEGRRFIGQTYRAGVTGRLVGVNISVRSKRSMNPDRGFPQFRLRVTLHRVRNGYPADRIAERMLDRDESTLDDFISFDGKVEQVAGEQYAIVVDYPEAPPQGADQWVGNWAGSTGNPYAEGDLCASNDGVTWFISGLNENDVHFRTYVLAP